jgi:hypothetical protein
MALATAKGGPANPADLDEDRALLARLEAWASGVTLGGLLDNPEAMQHAAGVLVEAKAQADLDELTRWAASLPPRRPRDPVREQAERERAAWQRRNDYSAGLAAAMARPSCEHRSCMPGRCVYA